jgi:hypothetical protein
MGPGTSTDYSMARARGWRSVTVGLVVLGLLPAIASNLLRSRARVVTAFRRAEPTGHDTVVRHSHSL